MSLAAAQTGAEPTMPIDQIIELTQEMEVAPEAPVVPSIPAVETEPVAADAETAVSPETARAVMEEARAGIEQLRLTSPNELRNVITDRVHMLDTVLQEREERAAAIEDAMLAQRILEVRRARARRIRRKVNIGSSLMAAMITGLVIASMF